MSAQILDGKVISSHIKEHLTLEVNTLKETGITPCLAVILVGQNPASQVYVRNKIKACQQVGITSLSFDFDDTCTQSALIEKIHQLNQDQKVHGILVQLPLPKHIDENAVLAALDVSKDVDGFQAENVGRLSQKRQGFVSCTPAGVMKMLEFHNISVDGKDVVIIGRSNIVGKPLAMLMINANATVTICHSHTHQLKEKVKSADIVIAAIGRPNFVTGDMVKDGAIVIDVGINRMTDGPKAGKLCGDVDFETVKNHASWITPVPGGVGPMTITMLLNNTVCSAKWLHQIKS